MDDRDKRDYFRLSDTIHVSYQRISARDAESGVAADFFTSDPNFHLLKEIYQLQLESAELLRSLTEQNRQLGSLLHNFDQRVELIARSCVSRADDLEGDPHAEISEGGVAYVADELLEVGQHLALRLLFQPSMMGLTCFAEVRHCRLVEKGNAYRIGTRFMNADYTTQRIISRHIIRRQSEERRRRLHKD